MARDSKIFAFEVWVDGCEHKSTVYAHTRGKAKYSYYLNALDWYPNVEFTWLRCRKLGPIGPQNTSEDFIRCATYRGMPDVRCGQKVKVGKGLGVIVGHNSSANFNVLFDEDSPEYAGLKLSVHPASIKLVTT